jgi:hypothetical protein
MATYKALMEESLYSDDVGSWLSREPSNTWEALNREEGAAERLTQIKPEDTIKLSKSIAECILKNIEDVFAGKLCTGSKRLQTDLIISLETRKILLRDTLLEDMDQGDLEA